MEPVCRGEQLSVELHPTRLFRAAEGDWAAQAAVILLSDSSVLSQLHCCITVDPDRNLAWLDWDAATKVSQRLSERERALVHLAAAVALYAKDALSHDRRSVELALRQLGR